jgi:hypothetical protein
MALAEHHDKRGWCNTAALFQRPFACQCCHQRCLHLIVARSEPVCAEIFLLEVDILPATDIESLDQRRKACIRSLCHLHILGGHGEMKLRNPGWPLPSDMR